MFKKILVAVLAAQLAITPVQAKQECTKAIIGIDDMVLMFVSAWLIVTIWSSAHEKAELKKQLEQEKAKQPAANSCLL